MLPVAAAIALFAIGPAVSCRERDSGEPRPENADWRATQESSALAENEFVGSSRCASCHAREGERWRGSDHARAMQEPNATTVLGDFSGATLDHNGVVSKFARDGDRFIVRTEGADGARHDFEVAYTFGVDPLQQYLVRMPGGRLKALSLAWDARSRAAGGQRWFDLNGAERVPPGDVLHWTSLSHDWNAQCAECHSTALRKGYDAANDRYATTWSEIDVGCEACHGPGSRHVAWAEALVRGEPVPAPANRGFVARLGADDGARWMLDAGAPIAHRVPARSDRTELDTCAPCHARRSTLRESRLPGEPLLDTHRPALLEPDLYDADGQMRDEVYEYGSFLQSPMYAAGVTCSDCHDPHAATLRAEGDATCERCHRATIYATPQHHHHAAESAGTRCVACHMPARTYMQIDVRHDHSFRVPRPDLSVSLGTPNACSDCHADRDPGWAAAAVARWFPSGRSGQPHYAEAFSAARAAAPDATAKLLAVVADAKQSAIVRASAIALLDPNERSTREVAERAASDRDPLIRLASVSLAERFESPSRFAALRRLLRDPTLAVRIEAARVLADVSPGALHETDREFLAAALQEYRNAQRVNDDLPESQVNLGTLAMQRGELGAARDAFDTALRRAPWFVPALVNLADLERAEGDDVAAEALLRRAVTIAPQNADVRYALGLARVRSKRGEEAVAEFARASELAPARPHFASVWALSLQAVGRLEQAISVLEAALVRHPRDRELLLALVTLSRDAGHADAARRYARTLAESFPDDPEERALPGGIELDPGSP